MSRQNLGSPLVNCSEYSRNKKKKRLNFCSTAASPRGAGLGSTEGGDPTDRRKAPNFQLSREARNGGRMRLTPRVGFLGGGRVACLADEVRGGEEALGAPERVVEVGAVGLELRGQPAVQD